MTEPSPPQRAHIAVGCTASTGEVGDFLYAGERPDSQPPVSPVFQGLLDLYAWNRSNGWRQDGHGLQAGYRKETP